MNTQTSRRLSAHSLTWLSLTLAVVSLVSYFSIYLIDITDPLTILLICVISALIGFAGRKVGYMAKSNAGRDNLPDNQWIRRVIYLNDTLMVFPTITIAAILIGSLIGFIQYQNSIK